MIRTRFLAMACLLVAGAPVLAEPSAAMGPPWARELCDAWNAEPVLTDKLVESAWIKNDAGRGYKTMQIYRSDCPSSERIELRIALREGKAQCVAGGGPTTKTLDGGADYLMWADTARWREMGAGDYGPMRAMMMGRLNFSGPKMEAMGNMGPFESFLRLAGKVPGDWSACP